MEFLLEIELPFCHAGFVINKERAVRLGDAPGLNFVKHGARLQSRSEVRFLTFPPIFI